MELKVGMEHFPGVDGGGSFDDDEFCLHERGDVLHMAYSCH